MRFATAISLGEGLIIVLIVGALIEMLRRAGPATNPALRGVRIAIFGFGLLFAYTLADLASDMVAHRPGWGDQSVVAGLDVTAFVLRIAGLLVILRSVLTWLPLARALSDDARHKASELAETQQRLSAVAAHLPGVIFQAVWHRDGRTELPYIDGNVIHLIGLEAGKAKADPQLVWQKIDRDDARAALERVSRVGVAPATVSFELRYAALEKQTRWLVCHAIATRRSDGAVTLDGIALDVGPQKLAQQRAADAEALLVDAIDSTDEGFAVYGADGKLSAFNKDYQARLPTGFDFEVGAHFDEITRRIVAAGTRIVGPDGQLLPKGEAPPMERFMRGPVEQLLPDGRWLRVSARPTRAGGVVVTTVDITERRRVQDAERRALQAAADAARAKSDFLANMSHELRTPLNAIIGFSEMMGAQMLGPLSDRYREYANDITGSARHLLALISDVLDLSKVEAGRMDLADDAVDIAEVTHACVTMIAPQAEQGRLAVRTDFPVDLPRLRGDRRRIVQIVLNLLTNAVKFTPAGGSVELGARRERGGLTVTIADTGIGIAAEDIPRVMQDWGQAHSELSRSGEGTGLGLPLSRRLMELHGGTLQLQSQPGVGTTVSLWFPADRVMAEPAVAASS